MGEGENVEKDWGYWERRARAFWRPFALGARKE